MPTDRPPTAPRCLPTARHLYRAYPYHRTCVPQREALPAFHFRSSLVQQAASSNYRLVEACVGSSLARHDLAIQQAGPDTHTSMAHFLLCGTGQLHDLHSKVGQGGQGGQAGGPVNGRRAPPCVCAAALVRACKEQC